MQLSITALNHKIPLQIKKKKKKIFSPFFSGQRIRHKNFPVFIEGKNEQ